jgi:hypothetical protein
MNRSCVRPVRPALVTGLLLAVLVTGLIAGPIPFGHAVLGNQARSNPGLVRIYEQGRFVGTGILVDRNWVLTASHILEADVSQYTFQFGGVDNTQDTEAGLRTFDRTPVTHPDVPDIMMLHFADPVPSDTPIAQVATTNPFTPTSQTGGIYGWSDDDPALHGSRLRFEQVPLLDLEARQNKEAMKDTSPEAYAGLGTAVPFVLPRVTSPGDSGGGFFKAGKVVGIHYAGGEYRKVNATGTLYEEIYSASYEIPLWPYAAWIRSVINGEGTSGPPPAHDELRRRRLQDAEAKVAGAPQVMTGLAPITSPAGCDPGDSRCSADPVTPLGILVGPSTTNGQVLTACAGNDTGDTCTFSDTAYAKDSRPTLRLTDPPQTGVDASTGRRDVIIWCRTTGTLTIGAPATTLLRLSFTNTDTAGYPPAYGWWDVNSTRGQPLPDNPNSSIDPEQLTQCAT